MNLYEFHMYLYDIQLIAGLFWVVFFKREIAHNLLNAVETRISFSTGSNINSWEAVFGSLNKGHEKFLNGMTRVSLYGQDSVQILKMYS